MSGVLTALTTYEEFARLPDPAAGYRYELHNGEVVLVPPPKPRHKMAQLKILKLLRFLEDLGYEISEEFPYKPAPQFQFWYADVAAYPKDVARQMAGWDEYKCYSPQVVIEVLSPSNTRQEVDRQRLASMSNGTSEFWVVDLENHVVTVTTLAGVRDYHPGEWIEVLQVDVPGRPAGAAAEVAAIFR